MKMFALLRRREFTAFIVNIALILQLIYVGTEKNVENRIN
jgi:hypothetical protein